MRAEDKTRHHQLFQEDGKAARADHKDVLVERPLLTPLVNPGHMLANQESNDEKVGVIKLPKMAHLIWEMLERSGLNNGFPLKPNGTVIRCSHTRPVL